MTDRAVAGDVAGAAFRFDTDAGDLLQYARTHLAAVANPAVPRAQIESTLCWHDGQPPPQRPSAESEWNNRPDRDLYAKDGTLYWFRVDDLRALYLRFRWREERLELKGDFYHRLGNYWWSDRLRRLTAPRQASSLRQRRFTTLLYYLVYYPCWWWLEHVRDLHPLHAAGVLTDAGVVLFAGGSGVGKSTLAVALAAQPGAQLLADSFVVHNRSEVLGIREPILLDSWSARWLGACGGILQPIEWRYGLNRCGYTVPSWRWADGGRAALLLLPRRSTKAYLKRLSPAQAHEQLSAANFIINDLRRYWAFAAVLEQIAPAGLVARREAQLAELTAEVPSYEIGLTPEMTSLGASAEILDLMRNKPLRVVNARP
jgi:hypothetical protein